MDDRIEEVLSELEHLKESSNFWNVPRTTGMLLQMMVMVTRATKVLEIGTSNGYSGIHFAKVLSHTGGILYTVESHKERFDMARNNFQRAGVEHCIRQIFGHAPEILSSLDGSFDIVFLDATKYEYKSYFEIIWPLLRKGGVCIADNCSSHASELEEFFHLIQLRAKGNSVLLPFDNGIMVLVKD